MAFNKKVWKDQIAQYTNRYDVREISDGTTDITRHYGVVSQVGDKINASNMNGLEDRISTFAQEVQDAFDRGGTGIIVDRELSPTSLNPLTNAKVTESLHTIQPKNIVTNLLNPTLGNTELNGVTCTNNGDGTYTLSGQATTSFSFKLADVTLNGTYKIIGCPSGGTSSTYYIQVGGNVWDEPDFGNGSIGEYDGSVRSVYMFIVDTSKYINLTFKPMITTNLNATYDDFVSYEDSFAKRSDVDPVGLSATADLNNELVVGKTITKEYNPSSPNLPSADWYIVTSTCGGTTDNGVQTAFNYFYGKYMRTKLNGVWYAWHKIPTDLDLGTQVNYELEGTTLRIIVKE